MRFIVLTAAALAGCGAKQPQPPEAVRMVLNKPIPVLDGAHLEARVVEVTYGPGGSSEPHSHTCPVLGHVLEGALRTQVRGGPVEVYQAGQGFYEPANGVHQVSANASDREPVRFLAIFLCDHPPPHTVAAPPPATP